MKPDWQPDAVGAHFGLYPLSLQFHLMDLPARCGRCGLVSLYQLSRASNHSRGWFAFGMASARPLSQEWRQAEAEPRHFFEQKTLTVLAIIINMSLLDSRVA
jgi:hypothetical protein